MNTEKKAEVQEQIVALLLMGVKLTIFSKIYHYQVNT